jgi:hypothetical protein
MRINFGELVAREHGLLVLLIEVDKARKQYATGAQRNTAWYRGFKPQMERIVGMYRSTGPEILQSSAAYDCAYETLYGCLVRE